MTKPTLADAPFTRHRLLKADPKLSALCDHLQYGRKPASDIKGSEGLKLANGVVFGRTLLVNRFVLCVQLGDAWYEATDVAPDDPAVRDLEDSMVRIGLPSRREEAEKREAEFRERRAREEEQRKNAEEAKQRAIDEAKKRKLRRREQTRNEVA